MSEDRNPFDQAYQKANEWLRDVGDAVGVPDRHRAHQALRGTLHALRDRLGVDEAAHLGAQLPLVVRGLYYEGWQPSGKPLKWRSQEEFLEHVREDIPGMSLEEAGIAASGVFAVVARKVAAGEIEDIRLTLPEPIRKLWPPD